MSDLLPFGIAIIVVIVFFALVVKFFVRAQRRKSAHAMESTVMRVAVSRINERGPIVAEQIYSALHGLSANIGFWDELFGRDIPRVSLEIASVKNSIQFYIWAPKKFKNVIESQIYAQYPDVEIEEVPDYAQQPFPAFEGRISKGRIEAAAAAAPETPVPTGDMGKLPVPYAAPKAAPSNRYAVTAELAFDEPDIYPIKRYGQFEDKLSRLATEPLAGITATLSKLNATDEQAWIQIVIQPVGDWWRKRGIKCLRIVKRGLFAHIFWLNKLATNIYLKRGFFTRLAYTPLYFLFWIFRGFSTADLLIDSGDSHGGGHEEELKEEMSRTHDREDPISAALDKVTRLTFDTCIRLVYIPRHENLDLAVIKLKEMAGSFKQFNLPNLNSFEIHHLNTRNAEVMHHYRERAIHHPMLMNVEELATIYHMPNKDVGTPNVLWVDSRKLEPPNNLPTPEEFGDDLTLMGKSNFRGHRQLFGIKTTDRRRHIYIIGKTGMGKSVLLQNMVASDVRSGKGLAVIDPHGDLADAVLDFVPSHRINDVVILDPSDVSHPFAFNMLENTEDPNKRNLMASGLLGVFKKMYAESWGPRLEHILRNCLLALTEFPNTSMLGIMRILVDDEYRKRVLTSVSNPMVRSFWIDEFGKMQDKMRTEAISPIQNKVGQFLSSPLIRNIVGQVKSTVNIRFMMDTGKIIMVNLSKGKIGEDNSSLLGSMLITKFQLDAMSRADIAENDRKDFYLYVDEFQNFATDAFATILSEARKYRLCLTMANQYVGQMSDEVRDAVFGNVGSTLSFQVGYEDAEYFSKQFGEEVVLPNDIVSLAKYTAYTSLMIDGMPSRAFSIATLPPPAAEGSEERREKIIRLSRERYCTPREVVEDKILRWSEALKRIEEPKSFPAKKFDKNAPVFAPESTPPLTPKPKPPFKKK